MVLDWIYGRFFGIVEMRIDQVVLYFHRGVSINALARCLQSVTFVSVARRYREY